MDYGLNFVENPRNLKTTLHATGDPYRKPYKAEQNGFRQRFACHLSSQQRLPLAVARSETLSIIMQLREVIAGLGECPAENIIFAERIGGEFRPESAAVVAKLSETELARPIREVAAVRAPGMEYFLEVFLALDMVETMRAKGADSEAIVQRIIDYAKHDA